MNRIPLTASASALAAALLLSPTHVSAQTAADSARMAQPVDRDDRDENEGFDKGLLGLLGLIGLAGLRRRPDHAHVHVERDTTTGPSNYGGATGGTSGGTTGGTSGTRRP